PGSHPSGIAIPSGRHPEECSFADAEVIWQLPLCGAELMLYGAESASGSEPGLKSGSESGLTSGQYLRFSRRARESHPGSTLV
ncbi:hypothetical protein, partial [Streptomyces lasiicapitis]|uniref:hypothetical protein n=1 Tax=Streptomyces lasiicapitis TaxID=1923961 RepID=UPI0036500F62